MLDPGFHDDPARFQTMSIASVGGATIQNKNRVVPGRPMNVVCTPSLSHTQTPHKSYSTSKHTNQACHKMVPPRHKTFQVLSQCGGHEALMALLDLTSSTRVTFLAPCPRRCTVRRRSPCLSTAMTTSLVTNELPLCQQSSQALALATITHSLAHSLALMLQAPCPTHTHSRRLVM